ncbi:sensory neuron membrane protein 1-like isoform X2 [Atheta coriaria]
MKLQRPHKIAIGSIVGFLFIVIFGWVVFPRLIKSQIKNMLALKQGNEIRDMYVKVPFPLTFKVYMFNVTNPLEISEKGAMPIVQEIGPYIYDEWKEKVDTVDDESDDTMEYRIKNTFIFNRAQSGSLTGDEVITMLHPLIAGIAMAVEREKPGALALVNKALTSIYRNPTHPFLTTTVDALLFSGVDIACNVTDFAGKAVCTQLRNEAKDLIEIEPGIFRFSLFGPKNGTIGQKVKVKRGVQNIMDLGQVVEFEGKPKLDMWGSEECNTYGGTDSTIFPPFLKEEDGLVSFAPDICRRLPAYYVENTKYDGISVRRYSADFGDQSKVKAEKCYCPSEDFCYKKGIHDMYKCVGAPFVASLPHFYLSDESYQKGVRGLNPTKDKHEIIILFESLTGSPVFAKKRMQFSLPIHAIPKVTTMANMPDVMMPLFWVEEGVELNRTWTGQLRTLFTTLKVVKVTKWLVLLGTLGGMGGAGYMMYQLQQQSVTITPVHTVNPNDLKNGKNNTISMVAQNGNNIRNGTSVGHVNRAMSTNEIDKY